MSTTPQRPTPPYLRFLYRWRWAFTALTLGYVAMSFGAGVKRVAEFSEGVAQIADTSNGSGAVKPLAFDPSMDAWFGEEDAAVETYYEIEKTFVAEDFLMVTFEVKDSPQGVFEAQSLATIARLSERFLTIPGVRHVRSLTYNPWIRWGTIEDELGSEEGLIISDLVEGDPLELSSDEITRRMVATLGAARTAERLGEPAVRQVLGADADFADHPGEPLVLGTILDETGTTTAIQVQVLRPRVGAEQVGDLFADPGAAAVAPGLSSIEQQRAALRGIEHFLRLEQGLAVKAPGYGILEEWIQNLPAGEVRDSALLELANPSKNFMLDGEGLLQRKYFEYSVQGDKLVDLTEPADPIEAPAGFAPAPLSAFEYHIGGVPVFERNFEVVGLADSKFVPLMFLVIALVLFVVLRHWVGVVVPLVVVFASIMAMVGTAFARGDLLNNLTMMSPNMLTAVGIADAVHLVASWLLLRSRHTDRKELILDVLTRNALPIALTSLTTAVGFYSLTVSKLVPVQMLGSMAALGTGFAWILSMTVVPALLSLVPHDPGSGDQGPPRIERWFSIERSGRFVDFVLSRRTGILVASSALLVTAIVGLLRVEVDSDFRGMFPSDNPAMADYEWIESRMGGIGDLELVLRRPEVEAAEQLDADQEAKLAALEIRRLGVQTDPESFAPLSPEEEALRQELAGQAERWKTGRIGVSTEFLESLAAFEGRLLTEMKDPASDLAVLTDLVSPLDTLRKIHQVQNQNQATHYRVPGAGDLPAEAAEAGLEYDEWTEEWSLVPAQDASTLVAQYYLQYESGARPGEGLWTQLSSDRGQFRMQGRIEQASSMAHLRAFQRIEEIAGEFPEIALAHESAAVPAKAQSKRLADLTLSGKTLLFARTSDLFARGFVQSMSLALAAITLLIAILFRSVKLALVSLIPNVLPIVLPLSVFGLLGVPLDGPAILVSSVALGVCVDDTIHFLTKFSRGRAAGLTPRDALVHTLAEAGAAMSVTTAVLIVGFSTLLLSDFSPNFQMGALASVMIALAWVADFVVTAAVLSLDGDPLESTASESGTIPSPA